MKKTAILKRGPGIVLFLTITLAAMQAGAVGGKIKYDDKWYLASEIRFKKTTQEYIITIKNTETPVPRNRVQAFEIDKPAQYDQAAEALTTGPVDKAIPILEQIVSECYMLAPWDARAMDLLGYAYGKIGDNKQSAAIYKKLIATATPSSITLEMQRRIWEALIAVQDKEALRQSVDATIAGGSRTNAAAAHIARADMARTEGNKQDALLDYLRVILLYEQVKSIQPEALYKTVQSLEELKDPRAEDFRKKLMAEYPQDPWASRR